MEKALWITFDMVLDGKVKTLLAEAGIVAYTRWPRLTGEGPGSGARLDDHVWPGANAVYLAVADEGKVASAMAKLQALKDEVDSLTGIWAFTTPVLETLS
jgi:hypothetical protein